MTTTPLPLITALARSGALDRAWALFEAGGYVAAKDSPAALAVKGRLLKDRALKASGAARRELFALSADAYAAADGLSPAPYLLINVATLAYLSGDHAKGAEIARAVLARLDAGEEISETPYWLDATRAEALLLTGDVSKANAAMTSAIARAPDSWSDHASTLRQLRLIENERGADAGWLDPHRPPQSLHFAGHLGVAGDDAFALRTRVDAVLSQERIGFGYGALAAGADIIIAESLLAHGADLHVVLPVRQNIYFEQSVERIGGDWSARYAACLDGAASITEATEVKGAFEPLTVALAGDISMGSAVLNARMLESSAFQLIVADEGPGAYGSGVYSARDGARWAASGHRQIILRSPRSDVISASGSVAMERPVPSRRLAAIIHAVILGTEALEEANWPLLDAHIFAPLRAAVERTSVQPMLIGSWGSQRTMAFAEVCAAHTVAKAMLDCFAAIDLAAHGLPPGLALTIGGHYDIAHVSPADGAVINDIYGHGVARATDIATQAHPGSFTVSDVFARALAFQTGSDIRAEHVGELFSGGDGEPMKLFAVRAG
jgi:MAP3K TRAFs-binding domain